MGLRKLKQQHTYLSNVVLSLSLSLSWCWSYLSLRALKVWTYSMSSRTFPKFSTTCEQRDLMSSYNKNMSSRWVYILLHNATTQYTIQSFRAVVFNLGYTYQQGYAETSYGPYKIEKNILFRDRHWIIRARLATGEQELFQSFPQHVNKGTWCLPITKICPLPEYTFYFTFYCTAQLHGKPSNHLEQ
jgi:hypothetical protein